VYQNLSHQRLRHSQTGTVKKVFIQPLHKITSVLNHHTIGMYPDASPWWN
jgi:hypothetical protein